MMSEYSPPKVFGFSSLDITLLISGTSFSNTAVKAPGKVPTPDHFRRIS